MGDKVLIIGGGMIGAETASYLSEQGKKVVLVEVMGEIARDEESTRRSFLMDKLEKNGVKIATNVQVLSVSVYGAELRWNEGEGFVPADQVVVCVGVEPENTLDIPGSVVIGNATREGNLNGLIREAYLAALNI